jgi:pyruvate dehydrogenase E1 component alpha subunit
MNAAAVWDLPVIFALENNLYGASTSIRLTAKLEDLARRGDAYGIPWEVADGQDVIAVNEAAGRAIARARGGGGPTLLELKTYRIGGHSRNDACGYRTREEEAEWAARDAIKTYRGRLLEAGVAGDDELTLLESKVENDIDEAVEYAMAEPSPLPEDGLKYAYVEEGLL